MKYATTKSIRIVMSLLLLVSLCGGLLVNNITQAESNDDLAHRKEDSSWNQAKDKVSPDLREQVRDKGKKRDDLVKVVLQIDGRVTGPLNSLLNRNGVHVNSHFPNFNSFAVELPVSVVEELAAFSEVLFVSSDREMSAEDGHISTITGADAARSTVQRGTLDGSGIGIAVLDSGIYSAHQSFLQTSTTNSRVIVSQDFTGEGRTDDPHGHGSHVASAAAANDIISKGKYTGSAPNANLINLRVLNSKGTGSVSHVLGALDWVMTNRTTYNIRVVNMSLGMPAIDSYKNDPVCRAVRRLVDAGIVVVVAAGNNGRDSAGNKLYGRIHCPGNEPSAITVGASNTAGTIDRSDDRVATFSSRGPTRSYWTDLSGIKHYDNLIKPDIVAPGNKIVGVEAVKNLLVTQYPDIDASVSKDPTRKMMRLNGTSMAAPVVAGAAAVLLQANPKLTPNMVKAILMYTAQQLSGNNMFEQGAGQLNIEGAVRLAKLVRTDLTAATLLGEPLLTGTSPTPQTSITYTDSTTVTDPVTLLTTTTTFNATSTFSWAQGIILNRTFASGSDLITTYQKIYGTGILLGDGTLLNDGVLVGDTTMLSSGVMLGDNILTSSGTTISDGTYFCSTGVLVGDGVMLSDGVLIGDGVLASDGVMLGDSNAQALSVLIDGDPTPSSKPKS